MRSTRRYIILMITPLNCVYPFRNDQGRQQKQKNNKKKKVSKKKKKILIYYGKSEQIGYDQIVFLNL